MFISKPHAITTPFDRGLRYGRRCAVGWAAGDFRDADEGEDKKIPPQPDAATGNFREMSPPSDENCNLQFKRQADFEGADAVPRLRIDGEDVGEGVAGADEG